MDRTAPWYTDAIIYGIDVEKFSDGNGDGIGDFIGLTERVPYLKDLGVTCIWLLPFYGSPDRDNGYDVSNYYELNPRLGTLDDFLAFLHRAGECGSRVIIDLVVNHSSDEHPWFQAARRDENSRFREYYVWSHDPPPVEPDDQPVFPGHEVSVWTYDEIAKSYYFHKFYHFQPDLNIANPAVREEILRIVDYWLSFGVSGFRIDAAPFLISGGSMTRSENHDPHGVLRGLSAYVRERRPGGLLLGEANVALDKKADYFGQGDQLGLLFNFALACHIFGALALQKAAPIEELLSLLPEPPANCGWVNFLRNLDELDFSRIPEDIRKPAFDVFAPDEGMRVFGRGIRRRIAPMLDGDQRRIELAFSLIITLRGAPMFVYGDEIGLGEDLSQTGRNAVRVPMQWTDGANGGFSTAPIGKLVQQPVSKGPYSYKRVNVEAQKQDPDSLLNRIRRMIFLRRHNDLFSSGRHIRMSSGNPAVLAHAFEDTGEVLVLLHNLSDRKQSAEVLPNGLKPASLTDLLTGAEYDLSKAAKVELKPFGYCWLSSERGGQ